MAKSQTTDRLPKASKLKDTGINVKAVIYCNNRPSWKVPKETQLGRLEPK